VAEMVCRLLPSLEEIRWHRDFVAKSGVQWRDRLDRRLLPVDWDRSIVRAAAVHAAKISLARSRGTAATASSFGPDETSRAGHLEAWARASLDAAACRRIPVRPDQRRTPAGPVPRDIPPSDAPLFELVRALDGQERAWHCAAAAADAWLAQDPHLHLPRWLLCLLVFGRPSASPASAVSSSASPSASSSSPPHSSSFSAARGNVGALMRVLIARRRWLTAARLAAALLPPAAEERAAAAGPLPVQRLLGRDAPPLLCSGDVFDGPWRDMDHLVRLVASLPNAPEPLREAAAILRARMMQHTFVRTREAAMQDRWRQGHAAPTPHLPHAALPDRAAEDDALDELEGFAVNIP
jgi:hypothetical protein